MCNHATTMKKRHSPGFVQRPWMPFAIVLAVLLPASGAHGQAPAAVVAKPAADYSKEAFIVEKLRTVATFENDGTSTRTTTSAIRVQSEAGVQHWGVISAGY